MLITFGGEIFFLPLFLLFLYYKHKIIIMENKNVKVSYSLTTPLFFIFLILKLTGFINWSWWWVTSPLWLPLVFVILVLGFITLIAYLAQK